MFPPKLETFVENSEEENGDHRSDQTADAVDSPENNLIKNYH